MTIDSWKRESVALLIKEGLTASPALDVRLLIEMVTGLDYTEQVLLYQRLLNDDEIVALESVRAKRLDHMPMAYIRGFKEFYGRRFAVDERVLIPRSDTETLVEAVLSFAHGKDEDTLGPIIDVCTGSGAVGITIACELGMPVTLSDKSSDALAVADANARALYGSPLPLVEDDLLYNRDEKYGIIVSNPPYITPSWILEVGREVGWEPIMALDGNSDDGLGLIRRLIGESAARLKKGGALFLECDYRQAEDVAHLLGHWSFQDVTIVRDLGGHQRVVWGVFNE